MASNRGTERAARAARERNATDGIARDAAAERHDRAASARAGAGTRAGTGEKAGGPAARTSAPKRGGAAPENPNTARRRRQLMKQAAVAHYGLSAGKPAAGDQPQSEADAIVEENARTARGAARKGRMFAKRTASVAAAGRDGVREFKRAASGEASQGKGARKGSFRPWSGPESAPQAVSWVKTEKVSPEKRKPARAATGKRTLETVSRPASSRRSKYRKVRSNSARSANMSRRAAKRTAKAAARTTGRAARALAAAGSALASLLAVPAAVIGAAVVAIVLIVALLCPVFTVFGGASSQGGGLEGNALTVYLYLHSKGMGDVPIAAILGNMQQESRMNPSSVNGIGAHGLCQWLAGRWSNLQKYAESEGKAWDDISLQLDFLYTQDEYPGASWRASFEADTDVDNATKTFMNKYERPGNDGTLATRQEYARDFLAKIRSGLIGSSSIPYYCQWDSRWKDHAYGNGSTLGSGGCSPTSLAMVISAATGTSVTPDVVADWAGAKYWVDGQGTSNGAMYEAAAKKWNLGTVRRTTSISEAVAALRAGHPVISGQEKGIFTSGNGHLIVLRGMSGDDILVHDPGTPSNSNRTFTQAEIDASGGSKGNGYYIFEGVTLSSGFGDETNVSDTAKAIVAAAKSEPKTEPHTCATWVSNVYRRVGIHISGNAADGSNSGSPQMYENFTYSTNRSELKPGMIIAARYSPVGHVGIYIGNGQVISNETHYGVSKLVTCSVDDWISRFGNNSSYPVRWGYPPGVN